MSRFRTLLLLMCLAVSATAWAELINENQARAIAAEFMTSRSIPATGLRIAHKAPRMNGAAGQAYYVFNAGGSNQGFIIVAGDDRAPSVLGYSDKGTFDGNNVPEAMQELLEGYAAQISMLDEGAEPVLLESTGHAIQPMVKAAWSQDNPYNILLPYVSTGKHAAVGCVATAMAQVLYYWKFPARPTTIIPGYTTEDLGIVMPALSPVDFNWEAMHDTYQTTDTSSTSALAAATLSLYCAQAVEMNFKKSSSGATTTYVPLALSSYFGFKPSAHSLSRDNYTTQEWNEIIYNELAANRPVIYSGSKASGGHAFVCDGYDGDGMFHINWGWNGQSNGYFLLNVLNPSVQGTGSATGGYGYILRQAAIVGLEPGDGTSEFMLTANNVVLNSATTTRSSESNYFGAVVSGRFYNYTSQILSVRFGWGLFDENNNMVSRLQSSYNTALLPGHYFSHTERSLVFGANITSGTYRIVPMCCEYGTDDWRPCAGADHNYIEVTINGNTCVTKGYGTAATRDYTINDIAITGTMHNGRPVDINVNMTNNGDSNNGLLYMHANGQFSATGYVGLGKGETGNIPFRFMNDTVATYTLTFSWNEDGSNPIATRVITLTQMPDASLSGTIQVLDITDADNKIITGKAFRIIAKIVNTGTTTYDEEISGKLFKNTKGNSGTNVQAINRHVTIEPGDTLTMEFTLDNVMDGWKYFAYVAGYKSGASFNIKGTTSYTIVFPEEPAFVLGDVDGNNVVDIDDVTAAINYVLTGNSEGINLAAGDINGDTNVDIDDITAIIHHILTGEPF